MFGRGGLLPCWTTGACERLGIVAEHAVDAIARRAIDSISSRWIDDHRQVGRTRCMACVLGIITRIQAT